MLYPDRPLYRWDVLRHDPFQQQPMIRFHDRHTSATLALLKTKNVKAVSCGLGHNDIRVTLETYTHYLPEMKTTWCER